MSAESPNSAIYAKLAALAEAQHAAAAHPEYYTAAPHQQKLWREEWRAEQTRLAKEEKDRQEAASEEERKWQTETPEGRAYAKNIAAFKREDDYLEEYGTGQDDGEWPRWLEDLCNSPPPAGDGVHAWLFKMARQLHVHFADKDEMLRFMRQKADHASRVVPDREIQGAIDYAADCAWGMTGEIDLSKVNWDETRPWPKPDLAKIKHIVAHGAGLAGLIKRSRLNCTVPERLTRTLLPQLFPGDPLLCFGFKVEEVFTHKLSSWRERYLHDFSFIVPNEMSAMEGFSKQGTPSVRCLDNTGPRRYLVIEFDFGLFSRDGKTETEFAGMVRSWEKKGVTIADACCALHAHLSEYLPLAMALSSAGKSEHAWYPCLNESEEDLRKFMRYAVSLGADRATWNKCQLVRLPDGTRYETGKRQQVHFFDPSALKANL